jgi:hypothetical protein
MNKSIITRTPTLVFDITPVELANMLWAMDEDEQAEFFNHLGAIEQAEGFKFVMQLQYLTDNKGLNSAGRNVMSLIGNYAHPYREQR